MKKILILLFVLQVLPFNEAYNLSCPSQAHWTLRAKSMCVLPESYTCLYNVTFQANLYSEICSTPNIINSGYKLVFQPHPNNATCSKNRFQPFIFESIGYSECAFQKSHCNGEGQTTYGNDNSTSDRTCSCNTDQGYTFVENLENPCFCNPSTEDCSCYYLGVLSKNETTGLKDVRCSKEMNINQNNSLAEMLNKSQARKNDNFDNNDYNLVYPTNAYRTNATKSVVCVLILVLLYNPVLAGIYVLYLEIQKRIKIPKNFKIVDRYDSSITVEWYIEYSHKSLKFLLNHRQNGSMQWNKLTLFTDNIEVEHSGRCSFKLTKLAPATWYELKMCSLDNYFIHKYTETQTQQTYATVPKDFKIVGSTDSSMTVEWYIEYSHTSMKFVLNHRQNGSAQWNMLTLFTDDITVEHNGRCLFKLTKLAPVTWYELQMCSSGNPFNRIYTETKTLQTKATDLSAFYNQLLDADKTRYTNLMQSTEMEERYFVKIMIVGKEEAGKTCLLRRLLNEDKKRLVDVTTTDGVNIVRRCKMNIKDGKWTIEKDDIIDDKADRIQRAENKSMKHDIEELNDAVHKTEIGKNKKETEINLEGTSNKPPNKFINGPKASSTSASYQDSRELKPESGSKTKNIEGKSSPFTNYPSTSRVDELNSFKKEETDDNSPLNTKSSHSKTKQENSKRQENSNNRDADNNRKMKYNELQDTFDTKESLKPKQEQNEPLLKMPDDLMSHVFSTSPTSNSSSERYAVCGLWDFAGQKEFYATHQAFLTSNAIYLVVADMDTDIFQQDVNQYFADFQNVGAYVDFWFDSIHCHRTVDCMVNERINYPIDPPVIIVFTKKDKCKKESIEKRKKQLEEQLDNVFAKKGKRNHLRRTFYISNIEDSDEAFKTLQQQIYQTAKNMNNWGAQVPLKWVLLEHLIEINIANERKVMNFSEIITLAKHPNINILDSGDVLLFLRFQHELGNIIFFDDIQDLIIINPQWLVDAFRCLVSHTFVVEHLQHCDDWSTFLGTGEISDFLIIELFKSKCGGQFLKHKNDLLKVMEKFDILVKIENKHCYIMPSMVPSCKFDTVCKIFQVKKSTRSSWMCLKFEFLPPAFFNHISVWFIKHFTPSKVMRHGKESLALYRGISIFDIDSSGLYKLLVTMSTDTIALQLLLNSNQSKEIKNICTMTCMNLIKQINAVKERYKLKISFQLHFKCSTGEYFNSTKSYKDLKEQPHYYCTEHNMDHQSNTMYLPWMTKGVGFSKEELYYLKSVALLHVAEDAVRIVFDEEFHPAALANCIHQNFLKLLSLREKKHLNKFQWKILFSKAVSSQMFNLGLMLVLLKSVAGLAISNAMPMVDRYRNDKESNISLIWYYRTKIVDNVNGSIEDIDEYQAYLSYMSKAIKVLSRNSLEDKCVRILKSRLDDRQVYSQEEMNYLRMVNFIIHIGTKVVRKYFDADWQSRSSNNPPGQIYNTAFMNKQQQASVFAYRGESSDSLDIRTMAPLLLMKGSMSGTSAHDMSHLLMCRNEITALRKYSMDTFEHRWKSISEAIIRLGGDVYISLCRELKMTPLHYIDPDDNIFLGDM